MPGPSFEAFVAPARARPQLWRLLAGSLLAVAIYMAFLAALFGGIHLLTRGAGTAAWLDAIGHATSPVAALLLLVSFLGMLLGAIGAARLLHRRPVRSLFGPVRHLMRDFAIAAGIALLVTGLSVSLWLFRFSPAAGLDPLVWLKFLPLALLGVLLQTAAEETLFRGYLLQQLAARFRSPLVWMLVPSLIFGAVHYDPASSGSNALLVVAATFVFGLAAADLTAATGSLGAAWGFHFANNIFAILLIATEGTLPGLALFQTPYAASDATAMRGVLAADLAILVVTWAIIRRALRR